MSYMMDNVSEMLHLERTGKIGGNMDWNNGSQIRQFYAGKRILLTGSTGFLGAAILEKLLRTCLEIGKIYLIIRTRGKMTVEERMEKYFQSPISAFARRSTIPCAIYRPAIIMSTAKEPSPGLITSTTGVSGLTLVYAMSLVHSLPTRSDSIIDFVPIDMTVNALLACIWDLSKRKKSDGPQVYNYGSSHWKPFFDKIYGMLNPRRIEKYPVCNMFWYPFLITTKHYYLFVLINVLFSILPAAVYDVGRWITGKKTQGLRLMMRVARFNSSLYFFLYNVWTVEVENTQNILVHMNKADYEEFPFDLERLDWDKFMCDFCFGVKTYLMKDTTDSIPEARKTFRSFMILHYTVCTCFFIFAMFLVSKLLRVVLC
ncbi:fatty acyl-CoA reductase wat-like [Megachile rotundata]|uniref:fatty acyl-CoA reductase wat-like n=1 Tax=Megachile rotundata TaxID=143995 RepID=UPI003FD5724C